MDSMKWPETDIGEEAGRILKASGVLNCKLGWTALSMPEWEHIRACVLCEAARAWLVAHCTDYCEYLWDVDMTTKGIYGLDVWRIGSALEDAGKPMRFRGFDRPSVLAEAVVEMNMGGE